MPKKYKKSTVELFATASDIARTAIDDNLIQISNKGLKILAEALNPTVLGPDIPPR